MTIYDKATCNMQVTSACISLYLESSGIHWDHWNKSKSKSKSKSKPIWGHKLYSTSIEWQPNCTCYSCVPPSHCPKFLGHKKTQVICFPSVPLSHRPTILGHKLYSTNIEWQPNCTCYSCVPPSHCPKFLGQKKTQVICFPAVPLSHRPTIWGHSNVAQI